jgi:beta-galactosidase/beta-glucuronidase
MLNPKALYFYMRRFFAPVLAAFVPEYESADSHSQPGLKSLGLIAVNETRNSITADFKAQLFDLSGKLIDQTSFPVSLAPFSTSAAFKLPGAFARPDDPQSVILFATISTEKAQLAQNTFLFVPDKYITWPQPKIDIQLLQVSDEFWKIVLYSEAPAKDVFVKPAQGFWPRDNFFDLLPHTELEITAKCAEDFVPDVSKIQLRTTAD